MESSGRQLSVLCAVVVSLMVAACGNSQPTVAPEGRATTVTPAAAPTPMSAPAAARPTRVLFVGNSLTFVSDLPQIFAELARSAGRPVEVDMAAEGGWTCADHAASDVSLGKIAGGGWDYVVLQEQSAMLALPEKREEQMAPAVRLLHAKITEGGAVTVLFMTWAGRDGLPASGYEDYHAMQAGVEAGYLEIADELGVMVVPVGAAWREVVAADPDLELWQRDGIHPAQAGSYLAACVFYATLFGASPEGVTYTAGLPVETALTLQAAAVGTVLENPERWHLR